MKKYVSEYVREYVEKLPLSAIQKLRLVCLYYTVSGPINRVLRRHKDFYGNSSFQPLVYSNNYFGNEYIFRQYAKINETLFAIIEHGLYFGNNTNKIPFELEWELGCILTYGEYRKKLIEQFYPDYYCEAIGAPILYADFEDLYRQKIIESFQLSGKVLLFFPVHGLDYLSPKFEIDTLSDRLLSLASENNCDNIIICTFLSGDELYQNLRNESKGKKIFIYSCGSRFDQEFLFRQRALISLSSITASNSLGTHVGNCVGLQKPHVILKQEITYEGDTDKEFGEETRSANWKDQYVKEQALFEQTFPYPSGQLTLTEEQYKFCDYYWGFSKKKTPEEIREIYHQCRKHAYEYTKRKNHMTIH